MAKGWKVEIHFKDGDSSEYIYEGRENEARTDAYTSCLQGSIQRVLVTPVFEGRMTPCNKQ